MTSKVSSMPRAPMVWAEAIWKGSRGAKRGLSAWKMPCRGMPYESATADVWLMSVFRSQMKTTRFPRAMASAQRRSPM
jgi:hypothetical protein